MADNLPEDFRNVEQSAIVGEDSRSLQLTHYVLAERLLQVEYASIAREIREEYSSETLTPRFGLAFFHVSGVRQSSSLSAS